MGVLELKCLVVNGSRLLGMSYAFQSDTTDPTRNPTHVVLIQSNPNPSSVYDITWSLVSAWPRNFTSDDRYYQIGCHVNPQTGLFSVMSNYTKLDIGVTPIGLKLSAYRAPGGFQYDPGTGLWTEFTLQPGYRWGDVEQTFALFNWPNSSTLYQANIVLSSADPTVYLGMLTKADNGSMIFVNAASWALNPNVYGYPTRVVAGKDSLYQFGSIVENNRTGEKRSLITKIPLVGDNGAAFSPSTNLPIYNASDIMNCDMQATVVAKFYQDTIYVLCEASTLSWEDLSIKSLLFQLKDTGFGNLSTVNTSTYELRQITTLSIFQPFGGVGEISNPWIYFDAATPSALVRDLSGNNWIIEHTSLNVNITEPYEGIRSSEKHPNRTPSITIGIVFGCLIFLVLSFFILRRCGCMSETWPRWKRAIITKMLEILRKDEEKAQDSEDSKKHDRKGFLELGTEHDKIEEASVHESVEMHGMDKILVTPDMDLSDIIDPSKLEVDTELAQKQEQELYL
ncbi:hypothetical protein BGZ65_010437, partial [Modicella reniformis]